MKPTDFNTITQGIIKDYAFMNPAELMRRQAFYCLKMRQHQSVLDDCVALMDYEHYCEEAKQLFVTQAELYGIQALLDKKQAA